MRFRKHPPELFGGAGVLDFDSSVDRRNFLRGAAVIGVGSTLALGGLGLGLSRAGAQVPTDDGMTDLEILNFALTLEYLEADFYARGLEAGLLSGRELELVAPIAVHEADHVAAVAGTITQLGGTPVSKPEIVYPAGLFASREEFLGTAQRFEEFGVSAYHGKVAAIDSKEILAAAASIAGVESRHAAILSDLTGRRPFPGPFEYPGSTELILAAVSPFLPGVA